MFPELSALAWQPRQVMAAHDPAWVLVGPAGGNKVKYICTTCGTSATVAYGQEPPRGKHQ